MLTDDPFQLFDAEDGNLIGTHPTLEAALDLVRSCIRRYGERSVVDVALEGEDDAGESYVVAQGEDLIRLAFQKAA